MVRPSEKTGSVRPAPAVEPTEPGRNRVVDLVRVLALTVVVFGHWAMQGIYVDGDGELRRRGILQLAEWAHPLTWALQVMPLFFLVGGFVNVLSYRHARARGASYGGWLAARSTRLVLPLLPLLAFWSLATPGAAWLGLGEDWVKVASQASLVPTWFLAVYIVVVALVPLSLALWERLGLWSVLLGTVLAGLIDLVSLRLDGRVGLGVGALNLVVLWVTVHQVGYAWQAGALKPLGRRLMLLVGGLGGALLLVWIGPYAVSMVGVKGFGVDNAVPPRATLLLVGLAQCGLVLLVDPALAKVAARDRVWGVTAQIGSRMMTIYLWHLTAFGILAGVSVLAGGVGLEAVPNTADWWWGRPLWFLLLAATTVVLVMIFGRFEAAGQIPARAGVGPWLPLAEVLATCVFIGLLAGLGLVIEDGGGVRWWLPLLALVVLGGLTQALGPHSARSAVRRTASTNVG